MRNAFSLALYVPWRAIRQEYVVQLNLVSQFDDNCGGACSRPCHQSSEVWRAIRALGVDRIGKPRAEVNAFPAACCKQINCAQNAWGNGG